MRVMLVDSYNLIHRSRHSIFKSEYSTVYNFFRSFRALVQLIKPDKIIMALEGYPKFRYKLYPEYKANRKSDPEDLAKNEEYLDFKRQKDIIVDILCKMPIEVIKHPHYEGDDLIGTLSTNLYKNDDCVVVSADSDFYQLIEEVNNVKIYNPIKKEYISELKEKYLYKKALIGDPSDNISGVPGVGPVTAEKICNMSEEELLKWLAKDICRQEIIKRNELLIKFVDVPLSEIKSLSKEVDFDFIKEKFTEMQFKSMVTDKAWEKFQSTFDI